MEHFLFNIFLLFMNRGLMLGLTLGAMCLLRPLLKRFLSADQRSSVWVVAWFFGLYVWRGATAVIPVTFQDLVVSRTNVSALRVQPAFLPAEYNGPGTYHLALTGGALIPIQLRDWMLWALLLIWLAGIVALLITFRRRKKKLMANVCGRQIDPKDPVLRETPALKETDVKVWLCEGLPTSFIISEFFEKWVYIQEELPPERLDLVLRHEAKHIKLGHCWWKWVATFGLVAYWWNPLVWLGFRYFCQDLELACDEAVMKELPPERRKEYAQTLLELGAGRQLWEAPLSFGECDGAVRVFGNPGGGGR